MSRLHTLAYAEAASAEVYAVCDVSAGCVRERSTQWGAATVGTDYRELRADPDVDAVEIITPYHLQARIGVDTLESGKYVSMQKAEGDHHR